MIGVEQFFPGELAWCIIKAPNNELILLTRPTLNMIMENIARFEELPIGLIHNELEVRMEKAIYGLIFDIEKMQEAWKKGQLS